MFFFLANFFTDFHRNSERGTKNTDSLKQENKIDSLTWIETHPIADTVLLTESIKSSNYEEIGFELMKTGNLRK